MQFHPFRDQPALRKIFDRIADILPVDGFFIDAHHRVLHTEAAHQRTEHTGLSGAVPAQKSGDRAGFRGDIASAEDRPLSKTDHNAVHYEFVLIHGSEA